jgi:hypothetical protein
LPLLSRPVLTIAFVVLALTGCTAAPLPSPRGTAAPTPRQGSIAPPSPSTSPSATATDAGPELAELPSLLLWQILDDDTTVHRTVAGDPGRAEALSVRPGWSIRPAAAGADVVAAHTDGSVAFGRVEEDEIVIGAPLRDAPKPAAGVTPACVSAGGPAAFFGADENSFVVAFRGGGWASVDAVGALGDCAWLDGEHLLVGYQGATDPIRVHPVTSGAARDAGFGGRGVTVSGRHIVVLDRTQEPNALVLLDAAEVDESGAAREVGRFTPTEAGARYLGGVVSPDERWLLVRGDRELGSAETEARVWAVDLESDERRPVPVPLPSGVDLLTDVSWPDL